MQKFDVVIFGAGFGGSLTALLLDRIGLSVALIDRGSHPRFAIGESSTPAVGYLLQSLSVEYDLPQFQPFCKYGTWREHYPSIACGMKRGFSYFAQKPGQAYQVEPLHANELLVTANLSDRLADTHWYRADVDAFYAEEVKKSNVVYLDQCEVGLYHADEWKLTGDRLGEPVAIEASFLIDATGAAGLVPRAFGIQRETKFLTNSRAVYGHFRNVLPWGEVLDRNGVDRREYPFDCDHAALHQVLNEGWMWQLRFNNGITSAGMVFEGDQQTEGGGAEWRRMLERYPSLAEQFAESTLVAPEEGLVSTRRLQRGWKECAGADWALLPFTAGFIDPLHSTGIAHALCGIERLVETLKTSWGCDDLKEAMTEYSNSLKAELSLIDALVAVCYRSRSHFELFAASTFFYFAAATSFEHQRCCEGKQPLFLCADDSGFSRGVEEWLELVSQPEGRGEHPTAWVNRAQELLQPWNRVGLFESEIPHMYYYTAAPEAEPR